MSNDSADIPPPPHLSAKPSAAKKWRWIVGAVAALLLIIGIIVSDENPATPEIATSSSLSNPAQASTVPTPAQAVLVDDPSTTPAPVPNTDSGDAWPAALAQLETLPIKGRAPKTGYSREAFGPAWTDDVNVEDGHNGCDTRNDILRRDLTDIAVKPGSNGCTVLSGILDDPYTGTTIPFTRGEKTSIAVQIDHVVALMDAWQKGAQQLDQQTRQDFANDPRNLQATDGPTNERKSAGDAATWLPPNKAYRCTYVSRQVDVKVRYSLWVTQAEHDAIANLLRNCGGSAPAPAPGTDDNPVPDAVAPFAPALAPAPAPSGDDLVHPGSFRLLPGAMGVSSIGRSMVCGLAKDGRHRWVAG